MLTKKAFIIITMILLSVFAYGNFAFGSWINLTTEELIEQADVILIGNIEGAIGERQIEGGQIQGFWLTDWEVSVQYYLKGEITAEELTVVTPGAKNKNSMSSIDYRLDMWGEQVLLFLKKRNYDGLYEPLSPQGVIPLQTKDNINTSKQNLTGEDVLKQFNIINADLQEFIKKNDVILQVRGNEKPAIKSSSSVKYLSAIITGIIILIFFIRKFFIKNSIN